MAGRAHRFGPFTFDPDQRLLYRNGERVALMPKTADLLHALLERRGQVVSREELMKRVWPDTRVEEIGLARNISLLRKALDDEEGESRYIETIPKRGYRFLAEEQPADPLEVRRSARRLITAAALLLGLAFLVYWQFYRSSRYVPPSPPGAPRVAVIPFGCSGGALCASAFARPFEDLLAAELASGGVRLVSPSTVHRYVDNGIPAALMGRLLGLDVVLEGSVTVLGPHVRIVARLSDVHSGRLVWSQSFDLPAADPALAQREAARLVASSSLGALRPVSSE
jgi:DNA-binding winged helix-turn-helix (wHTH) protein/TolB-like protein